MRLASYSTETDPAIRIGFALTLAGREMLVDATRSVARYLGVVEGDPAAAAIATARIPGDMTRLLEGGERSLDVLRAASRFAADELAAETTRRTWSAQGGLHDLATVRFAPPVPRPGKIIMIGSNYHSHAAEVGKAGSQLPNSFAERPPIPPAFAKFASVLTGHRAPIVYPRNTHKLDYEAELCVVIGRRCKDVAPADVPQVVAGYTIANDVSMRDIQFVEMRRGATMLGKNLDTAMPTGPYLVTRDDIPDPQRLQIRCWVNGEERQSDTTANMVVPVADLVAYLSRMTLEPGDMISTGCPAGVGIFWKPPEHGLLRVDDLVEIEIEGIGRLSNRVAAEDASVANDPARGPRR